MAPTFLPNGYHDSESKKFQNYLKSWLTKNFVARKLNQGSNSWMILSYLMLKANHLITEKIRTSEATEQISKRIVILKAGFHFWIDDS